MLCTSMALDYTKQKMREHLINKSSGRFGVRMKDIRQTFAARWPGHVRLWRWNGHIMIFKVKWCVTGNKKDMKGADEADEV